MECEKIYKCSTHYATLGSSTARIDGYLGSDKQITIPSTIDGYTVVSIGENAFYDSSVEKVEIPDTVTKIDPLAFSYSHLTEIVIPDSVTDMGVRVFQNCEYLSYAKLPNSRKNITIGMFLGCKNLTNIELPNGVTNINDSAFFGCSSLKNIEIPNSVAVIGNYAFEACESLTKINIPNSVINIGAGAFTDCSSLQSITIPSSVTCLDAYVFMGCSNLKNITIPTNVTTIEFAAFSGCSNLKSITIPTSVTTIGDSAFNNCNDLKDVYYSGTQSDWNNILIGSRNECLINATIHFNSNESLINSDAIENSNAIEESHNSFKCSSREYKGEYGYYYNDNYFSNVATEYNHHLATMSLCLALSTYNASDSDYNIADKNVKDVLTQCGFSNYEELLYHSKPSTDSIACAIASKSLKNDTALIAVAVRSGGYEKEWASNMTVGTDGNHDGFQHSADTIYRILKNYVDDYDITGNVKFWIVGYSRGGATANLLAAKLCDEPITKVDYTSNKDVYAYSFATPAGASISNDPHNTKYNNIYSIIDYNDPVPLLAPMQWGFDRYGITKVLPSSATSNQFTQYEVSMLNRLEKMGYQYKVHNFHSWQIDNLLDINRDTLGVFLRKFLTDSRFVETVFMNRNLYNALYQDGARNVASGYFNLLDWVLGLSPVAIWSSFHQPIIATLMANSDLLAIVHAEEANYIAWMQSMDSNYVKGAQPYFTYGDYRVVKVNCPVDVYAYDKNENLVAAIINEAPQDVPNSSIISSIDDDGQKVVYLPCDAEYTVKVVAREACKTTYTLNECTGVNSDVVRIISYNEINMKANQILTSKIDIYSDREIENGAEGGTNISYKTNLSEKELVPDLDVSGNDVANYTFNISVEFYEEYDEERGTITGGGIYTAGDFCCVIATNNAGYEFDGWYIDDVRVSKDYQYRFVVEDNVAIKAQYIVSGQSNNSTDIKEPTSNSLEMNDQIINGSWPDDLGEYPDDGSLIPDTSSSPLSIWLVIVLIIILVIAVAAGVAVVLIRKRKLKNNE